MTDKEIYEVKQGHGFFKGHIKKTDVIGCIDSTIVFWHTLIAEVEPDNDRVKIIDNTKRGWSYAYDGDGIDLGANRKNHRGTVQRGVSHTLKTGSDCGVILIG